MMRVLHVYSGNLYGGVESMLFTLARERACEPALEPHFALSFPGRLAEELTAAGTPPHLLGEVRARRPDSVLRARRRLAALLRERRFDAVVCHSAWPQALFGPVVRRAGLPLVFFLHDAAGGGHWTERWARRTPPDLALCNSRFTLGTLLRLYPRAPAAVLHCPVAEPRTGPVDRAAVRRELGTPADAAVIVRVARPEPWKGHAHLLEALGCLADVPGWVCWVVGGARRPHERAHLEELRALALARGVANRVRFTGERADVPRLLAAADLFCHSSTAPEPFGIAVVEALYAGLPVVATALGGPAEVLDGSCALLVPPGDAGCLAEALRALLASPERRQALGAAGPERARAVSSPAVQLPRLHELLRGTLAARGAA